MKVKICEEEKEEESNYYEGNTNTSHNKIPTNYNTCTLQKIQFARREITQRKGSSVRYHYN